MEFFSINKTNQNNDVSPMEIDFEEIKTTTEFIPMDYDEVPYTNIMVPPQPVKNNIHIVVDGLNVLCGITKFLNEKGGELGRMNDERNCEEHQFNDEIDLLIALNYVSEFFEVAIPSGSTIHFVIKQFGEKLWEPFKKNFVNKFLKNQSKFTYHLYEAIPHNLNYAADKECDDRFVLRLYLMLKNLGKNVHIITNDKYRSIGEHWNYPSLFVNITEKNDTKIEHIRCTKKSIQDISSHDFYMRAEGFNGPKTFNIGLIKPIRA